MRWGDRWLNILLWFVGSVAGAVVVVLVVALMWSAVSGEPIETAPDPYVVWCERLWTGPENGHHVVVMVWSDGEIWAAQSDHLASWNPLTTVRDE